MDVCLVFSDVVAISAINESSVNSPSEEEDSDCTIGGLRALGGCLTNSPEFSVAELPANK